MFRVNVWAKRLGTYETLQTTGERKEETFLHAVNHDGCIKAILGTWPLTPGQ